MKQLMRIVVGLVALFCAAMGFGFLLMPASLAESFALAPLGTQGLASLRADFPGFFLTGAAFALYGAWRADPQPLLVPLALIGIAIAGRFVSIAIDGIAATTFPPIIAEALMITAIVLARRSFAQPGA